MENLPSCQECNNFILDGRANRRFCSTRCKGRWWKKHPHAQPVTEHACRQCANAFPIGPGQNNKWLCSEVCRKAALAKSVRSFHERRPWMDAIYREKTRTKHGPDSQNVRFYKLNPTAPRVCEACGESRVTEIAHKPGHERMGARRGTANMKWPDMVWVLCPTCHRLLDRMNYSPAELGL